MSELEDSALIKDIDSYVDDVWADVLKDIAALVAIPSVADAALAEPGAPHGPNAKRALETGLGICERLGLEPHDMDGWIGYADLPGESPAQLATIAHIDVVPAGTGWTSDPFAMQMKDGYLIGRGVLDDKGPAVLSMYAAHYFIARGIKPRYSIRVMLGSDEEVSMTDVAHYQETFDDPAFLFTPDADFPVCCGEKGRVGGAFVSKPIHEGRIVSFEGGTVPNAVPGVAEATVRLDGADAPEAPGIQVEMLDGGLARLVAHGKGGHASLPEGTVNAIGMLVGYILEHGLCSDEERGYLELLSLLFATTDGSSLGIDATDDLFEPLTCIGGTIRLEDGRIRQTIDIRYPKSTTGQRIEGVLSELAAAHDSTFDMTSDSVPFYIDPANPAVTALVDAYNTFTGKHAKPFTIGGGTYARHFKNAVSFGPEEPGEPTPAWVGSMHGPDEGVSEELLKRSLRIYVYALNKLMDLDF